MFYEEVGAEPPATIEVRAEEVGTMAATQGGLEAAAITKNFEALNDGTMDPQEYLYHQRVGRRADELTAAGITAARVASRTAAHNLDPYVQAHPELAWNSPSADTAGQVP